MSLDECPEKVLIRKRYPRRKVVPYHKWTWLRVGKAKDGADLRDGVCKLCGYKLGIVRFCSRCGLRIDGQWKGKEDVCTICIEQIARKQALSLVVW